MPIAGPKPHAAVVHPRERQGKERVMSSTDPHESVPIASADLPPAVKAQLLAAEHWSLLATRGTTWSEVMSRISIHLTVASASLVVLALVTQASGFGTAFQVLSIGLTSTILVLGTMTGIRLHNASRTTLL